MKVDVQSKRVLAVVDERDQKFAKVTIVVEESTGGKYPEWLAFEFSKDKADDAARIKEGQHVDIGGYLSSREWKGRYYTGIRGTFCKVVGGVAEPQGGPIDDEIPFSPYGGIS